MERLLNYCFDLCKIDRTAAGLTAEQIKKAESVFNAKTARANSFTRLKQKDNYFIFSVYGTKKINLSYAQTDYIFRPSGVLQISKYDPRTNRTNTEYYKY